jgi:hypothetical protein
MRSFKRRTSLKAISRKDMPPLESVTRPLTAAEAAYYWGCSPQMMYNYAYLYSDPATRPAWVPISYKIGDPQGQRVLRPCRKGRDDDVVEGEREGEQATRADRGRDHRQRYAPERHPAVGAEIHRRFFERARQPPQPGQNIVKDSDFPFSPCAQPRNASKNLSIKGGHEHASAHVGRRENGTPHRDAHTVAP